MLVSAVVRSTTKLRTGELPPDERRQNLVERVHQLGRRAFIERADANACAQFPRGKGANGDAAPPQALYDRRDLHAQVGEQKAPQPAPEVRRKGRQRAGDGVEAALHFECDRALERKGRSSVTERA